MRRAAPRGFLDSASLLWTRRFGTFWAGSLLSNIGTWMQQVAEPWLVLSLSGSPVLLGLDAFAMDAPAWALTLLGGVLADHRDRRRVIFFFQAIQGFCPLLLVLLMLTGLIKVWMIVALSLVVGITDALSMPAFASIVPLIVPAERIGSAIALNSTQFNLSRILGPALAALVMARYGVVGCFAINGFSYVPFLFVIFLLRIPRSRTTQPTAEPWYQELRGISHNPELRSTLLLVLGTSLFCGPLVIFCPVLVREVFRSDAAHFGHALAAFGVGGLLGAMFTLGSEGYVVRRGLCFGAAIAYAGAVIAAALSPSLTALTLILVCAGFALTSCNATANSILQTTAHDGIRGQTASLSMLAMRGGLSLGNLATGLSTHLLGVRHALLLNGCLAIPVQCAVFWPRRRPSRHGGGVR